VDSWQAFNSPLIYDVNKCITSDEPESSVFSGAEPFILTRPDPGLFLFEKPSVSEYLSALNTREKSGKDGSC
jgi:hypothetical protein